MIVSAQNERLKDIRRLRRCKGGRALLEGAHLIREALAAGVELESVLASPQFLDRPEGRDLAASLEKPVVEIAHRLLESVADADSPRGVVAVARLPRSGADRLPRGPDDLYLYLDRLQDPGNLGALARTGEGLGAAGLALAPGSAHPNHPRALRASAGSLLRLPVAVGVPPEELDRHLATPPATWIALVPRDGTPPHALPPIRGRSVLAVGAEGPGLSQDLLTRADHRLTLPVAPPVESLNATVAAALALYELRRPRQAQDA